MKKILLMSSTVTAFVVYVLISLEWVGGGYKLIDWVPENRYVTYWGSVVIGPTLWYWEKVDGVYFGMGSEVESLECNGGYKVRITERNFYFYFKPWSGYHKIYEGEGAKERLMEEEPNSRIVSFEKGLDARDRKMFNSSRVDYTNCRLFEPVSR